MEKIMVYLLSDHVIQQPTFGIRENVLYMAFTREVAVAKSSHINQTMILCSYYLNLSSLSVKDAKLTGLIHFDSYDVIINDEQHNGMVALCSESALKALKFDSATFI